MLHYYIFTATKSLCHKNRYFKVSKKAAWLHGALVLFTWMTAITWALLSPGCKETKARGVSGGKLHIGFSVLWCLIDSIFTEAGDELYQSLDTFSSSLPRHCGSTVIFFFFFSKILCFSADITLKVWVTWGEWAQWALGFSVFVPDFIHCASKGRCLLKASTVCLTQCLCQGSRASGLVNLFVH